MDLSVLVVRAADEGMPIAALKRVFNNTPDGEPLPIRSILHDAVTHGRLVQMPAEDWPVNTRREDRVPTIPVHELREDEAGLLMKLARVFRTTRLESSILLVVLRRHFATREMLHDAVEANRGNPDEPTDKKIVDVVVCKLRKKLTPKGLNLHTVHSQGYEMSEIDRQKAWDLVREAFPS